MTTREGDADMVVSPTQDSEPEQRDLVVDGVEGTRLAVADPAQESVHGVSVQVGQPRVGAY